MTSRDDALVALRAAVAVAMADTRFVPRMVAAMLGRTASPAEATAWLLDLASSPWSGARIDDAIDAELGAALGGGAPAGAAAAAGGGDAHAHAQACARALRRTRTKVVVGTLLRDVAGVASLAEVMAAMTMLAQRAVQRAVAASAAVLAQRHGVPRASDGQPQDLLVAAMGKAGGGELNVSSDLDLVFVYIEEGHTDAGGAAAAASAVALRSIPNQEFFERLGRALIAMLSDPSADGFVFRVDMRLRPNGTSGPLVVSGAMLEEYLMRQGREWERFAWLKARVISAPVFAAAPAFDAQQRALLALVRPFVFRNYLDFNAIAALRELHARIRTDSARRARHARGAAGPRSDGGARSADAAGGDDVKLGRGGIREIEFIAQIFQLIRGGREPRLAQRATLATLDALVACRVLDAATGDALSDAYVLLRRVEHALQYVDDAQTHRVPDDAAARAALARLLRLASADVLMARLASARGQVASAFDAVFGLSAARTGQDRRRDRAVASAATDSASLAPWGAARVDEIAPRLAALGFARPQDSAARLGALFSARQVAAASDSARGAIERLVAHLCESIPRLPAPPDGGTDADELLARCADLIEVIAGRSTYVALLDEFPRARARVLRLLAASRWATDYLVRHPILLDELLDQPDDPAVPQDGPAAPDSPAQPDLPAQPDNAGRSAEPDWSGWRAQLRAQLDAAEPDTERQMNLLRDAHHAQMFRLLIADLDGRLTIERLADHLTQLADATLAETVAHVWRGLAARHRESPRFAVVAYGKLGGKELGYASDLDLIFVYDDDHPDAAEVYAQLVRRIIVWLTTHTSSGILFDIDLRLRPNGNAGLLVTSVAAFERYQHGAASGGAWVWEHQALTRARACAGDAAVGARIEAVRRAVLAQPRLLPPLADAVIAMRARMLAGHPNRSAAFDLKHDRGGMVDVEFTVQFLVLAHAARQPQLLDNRGNLALLQIAAVAGLLDPALAAAAAGAYRDYRRRQHALRLNGSATARVEPALVAGHSAAVRALWQAVFGTAEPLRGDANAPLRRDADAATAPPDSAGTAQPGSAGMPARGA